MIKVVKSFVAFFVAVSLLIILNSLLPTVMFLSSWWFLAIIIAISNFLIVYLTTSPRKCESYGMVTREYIMSGRGELKQEVNDIYFKQMELLEETSEGRCFINANGSIVTTKYVTNTAMISVKKIKFPIIIYTVFTAFVMFVFLSGFCQQTDFNPSDVNTIGPAFEKSIVLIKNQVHPISVNIERISNNAFQIKKEIKSTKMIMKKSLTQAGDNILDIGKTNINAVNKGATKIVENVEIVEKKFRNIF